MSIISDKLSDFEVGKLALMLVKELRKDGILSVVDEALLNTAISGVKRSEKGLADGGYVDNSKAVKGGDIPVVVSEPVVSREYISDSVSSNVDNSTVADNSNIDDSGIDNLITLVSELANSRHKFTVYENDILNSFFHLDISSKEISFAKITGIRAGKCLDYKFVTSMIGSSRVNDVVGGKVRLSVSLGSHSSVFEFETGDFYHYHLLAILKCYLNCIFNESIDHGYVDNISKFLLLANNFHKGSASSEATRESRGKDTGKKRALLVERRADLISSLKKRISEYWGV